MKKTIFLVLGVLILLVLGYQVFDAYLLNHTYYWGTATDGGMLGSAANRQILIWSLVLAALPVLYLLFVKKKTIKGFSIALFIGLFLFSVAEAAIKNAILGPGFLIMLFKYAIIFAIIAYFLVGLLATGTRIRKKLFGTHERTIEHVFLNIGLGLIAFCLLNMILILFHLFFGIVVALLFIGYGVCSRKMRKELGHAKEPLEDILNAISRDSMKRSPLMIVYVLLILFSLMYVYHGFVLSDIPYPTAWDANHAYMYYPRIWALNNGYYRQGDLAASPQIWYGYLTFRFKFIYIFGMHTWISADNLAVIMNFISGIFVMVFGLILVKEVISFLRGNHEKGSSLMFVVGRSLILLWLTSGMGAFLVFVDNKTDLGVMALTILALYSGFFFINQIKNHTEGKHSLHYAVLSGLFFAGAILAKPTATFDVINFSITLISLWFGAILAVGIFLGILGMLGKSGILTVQKFMSPGFVNQLLAVGGTVSVVGVIYTRMKKKRNNLRYVLVWACVIIATLVIVKTPYLIAKELMIDHHIQPTQLIKDIFLTKANSSTTPAVAEGTQKKPILLASTYDYNTLLAADLSPSSAAVTTAVSGADISSTNSLVDTLAACKAKTISHDDLYKNLQTPPGSALNEDVGRYIGYGWKTFNNPWRGFLIPAGCHGRSTDAKILCENASLLDAGTITGLQEVANLLPAGSQGQKLMDQVFSGGATTFQAIDAIKNLKAYYQDKSRSHIDGKVNIPFVSLVPFNITFNRSLQNLTSYYTDIGVIWLLSLFLILIGFIYSLVKRDKQLFALTLSTLCGWALWWVAGGAILWYSLGVVIRTIIAMIAVLYTLGHNNNATQKKLFAIIITLLAVIGIYQLMLNFIRISSQGGAGPFVRYRANVGNVTNYDKNLQPVTTQKIGYNADNVFNLQFGYYNKTLDILEHRAKGEGFIVAGTYLPYFIRNQNGIKIDGFLVDFRKILSDNDPCNTYLRMLDQKTNYIALDPNIASVVMGDANSSLMDRVFGKLDPTGNHVMEYGSITMIVRMVREGYMSLASTNIIAAKYAFTLSPSELKAAFPDSTEDELVLRSKLATLRFWPTAEKLFSRIPYIFTQRMTNGGGLSDIADILGKNVDVNKIQGLANTILTQRRVPDDVMQTLNVDEKTVLVQYLSLYNIMKSNPQQYQQYISSMLQNSILGSSQVMMFKLN